MCPAPSNRERLRMGINQTRAIFLFILAINLLSYSNANNPVSSENSRIKILAIFPHPGKSHFFVFKPFIEELARRGNELTVISYFPRTEKDEHLPTYKDISLVNKESDVFLNVVNLNEFKRTSYIYEYFSNIFMLSYMRSIACENLRNPGVKKLIENGEKFDLVLVENFNTHCFMSLVYKLNVPFIDISTHQPMPWAIYNFRLSNDASFIPMSLTSILKPMNLFYRTINALSLYVSSGIYWTIFQWNDQAIVKEIFGPDVPNVMTINKNVSVFFINTHYTIHGGASYPPNVIEVGGIHIESKRKPLPRNIAKFLDEAHEGVLYFNLGSMIKMSTIPKDKLNILIKVFRSIPRKVIWKWEQDDIPELPGNVMIQKWLPQYDILSELTIFISLIILKQLWNRDLTLLRYLEVVLQVIYCAMLCRAKTRCLRCLDDIYVICESNSSCYTVFVLLRIIIAFYR